MKRLNFLRMLLVLVALIAVAHTTGHFYVWGTGIPGFSETGISGLAVGEDDVGEEATDVYGVGMSLSQIFVIGEWISVFSIVIFLYVKGKSNFEKEVRDLQSRKVGKKGENKTDLDELYELLQDKKRIGFLAIQKVFDVDGVIVSDWADTLESGNLASIDYPRMGDPELVLVDKK